MTDTAERMEENQSHTGNKKSQHDAKNRVKWTYPLKLTRILAEEYCIMNYLAWWAHTWRWGKIENQQLRGTGGGHTRVNATAVDDPHAIVSIDLECWVKWVPEWRKKTHKKFTKLKNTQHDELIGNVVYINQFWKKITIWSCIYAACKQRYILYRFRGIPTTDCSRVTSPTVCQSQSGNGASSASS